MRDEDSPEQTNDDSSSQTEDQGIVIVNEGGASIDYTRTHTHVLDITTNTGTYVELTTIKGAIGDKATQPSSSNYETTNDDSQNNNEEATTKADSPAQGIVQNKTLTGSGMFGEYVTVLIDQEITPWEGGPNSAQDENETETDSEEEQEGDSTNTPLGDQISAEEVIIFAATVKTGRQRLYYQFLDLLAPHPPSPVSYTHLTLPTIYSV